MNCNIQHINERAFCLVFENKPCISFTEYLCGVKQHFDQRNLDHVIEIVVGLKSLYFYVNLAFYEQYSEEYLLEIVKECDKNESNISTRNFEIGVTYNGPDLLSVSSVLKLSISQVIQYHSQSSYTVGMIGFLPGFPYLVGLHPSLFLHRKEKPSLHIKKGAVAIADNYSGIYPQDSPGGWHIIGHTDFTLFTLNTRNILKPGDKIRFVPL